MASWSLGAYDLISDPVRVDPVDRHVFGPPLRRALVLAPPAAAEHGALHLARGVVAQALADLAVLGADGWKSILIGVEHCCWDLKGNNNLNLDKKPSTM